MRLIFKTLIFLFTVIYNFNAFSQEKTIVTKFNQDGGLYKTLDQSLKPTDYFKENEKCIIISYLGNYIYKVKYKEWEGFVKDQFLIINEDMMDLFFANEEKQRLEAIATKKKRQKKIRNLVTAEDEKQKKIDSIANVKEEQKKKELKALEIAKEYENLLNQQRNQDSIAKAKNLQKIKDSINKVREEEERQIALLRYTKRKQNQLLAEQKKLDSIANLRKKNPKIFEEIKFRNTCHYLINEYDQYYGRQLIITDKYTIAKNLNIELIREGNSVKIHLNTKENLGCASYVPNTRSSAIITLENDQIITLYHSGSLDCNDFSLKAELSESKMDLLKYSPIKSIFFRGTKGSITILDIDYKMFFIDKLKCIE